MGLQVPRVRDGQLPVNADDDDNCSTDNHGTVAPHGKELRPVMVEPSRNGGK